MSRAVRLKDYSRLTRKSYELPCHQQRLGDFVSNQTNSKTLANTGKPATSYKTLLRRSLGNSFYRAITQTPRVINFIIRPRYESEIHALPLLVREGDVCFDIGANYGHYSRLLSALITNKGAIYAFEPSSITCRGLRNIKRLLCWKNVTVEQCALADVDGELTLTIPIKSHGGLGIALAHLGTSLDRDGISETVAVKTLDGYISEHGIKQCDFIKCDVEGAELLVLMGATNTIEQFKPTMMLEIDASYLRRHEHSIEAIEALLHAQGYAFYIWEDNALKQTTGLQNRHNNFAIHPSRNLLR
jgi:FkbM family methyltransferase